MWVPDGTLIAKDSVGRLVPSEVLFEYEVPLTFICRDRDGQLMLAHALSDGNGYSRYLVAVTNGVILENLKAGRVDLVGSLRQPRAWVADVGPEWEVINLWITSFERLPKEVMPEPGVMLKPEFDPLFRIRLIGSGVVPGKTSASHIRMAAQAAESGLRGLARIALDAKKQAGRVPRDVLKYSDLPFQYSRVGSFEMALGRPRDMISGLDDEVFRDMGILLKSGLEALRADGDRPAMIEGVSQDQAAWLFEAIRALTPPMRGGVEQVEIGGVLTSDLVGSRILTRDDRQRSSRHLMASRVSPVKDAPFRVTGVAEAADQGEDCFILRQLAPAYIPGVGPVGEIKFTFEDHLFDRVSAAWNSQDRVAVVGERVDACFHALDLQLAHGQD